LDYPAALGDGFSAGLRDICGSRAESSRGPNPDVYLPTLKFMKFSSRHDFIVTAFLVTAICAGYWLHRGFTGADLVTATCLSVLGIFGGPVTAWFSALTYPGDTASIEGMLVLASVSGLLLLFWVPYLREPARLSFALALGMWLASGWFFTFGVRL
jgi:hypothetical protein